MPDYIVTFERQITREYVVEVSADDADVACDWAANIMKNCNDEEWFVTRSYPNSPLSVVKVEGTVFEENARG